MILLIINTFLIINPFISYFIKQIMLWIFYKKLKNKLSSKNVTNVIFIAWETITFDTYVHAFIMINYNCN